ncbi:MAG TPA: TIGR03435 family protein [Bryobacteraceae bacterium]|nr:TIGR03435 family protein [Bryobacteraceae bacterium]
MKPAIAATAAVAFFQMAVPAQTPPAAPAFEVADVHVSTTGSNRFADGGFLPGGRYQLRGATMVDLIATAWGIDAESVFGGPSWLESDRFDIVAKAPPASTEEERALMLRTLLTDRFKLALHKDEKPLTVFALTVVKRGAQFAQSAGGGEPVCQPKFDPGPPAMLTSVCTNMTMKKFGDQLHLMAGGYILHQVVDLTDLKGAYDLTLKWSPRGGLRQPNADSDQQAQTTSIFEALDKQLGLKLEAVKRSTPVLVVDSVNRTPTENAPGIGKKLPADMTEFEAADIKPNKSGSQIRRIQPKPGGRIEVENVPLKMLVSLAWDFDQDRIVNGPKWMDTDAFNIVAKTAILPGEVPPPFETVKLMLRGFLTERFNMKIHTEDQPVQVWSLVLGKHGQKLKEADPASRSNCKRSSGEIGSGASAVPALVYACQNTTMAQLAEAMHNIAPAYVDHVAVDMTGLKGGYDFTLTWTARGLVENRGRGAGADPAPIETASDPSGGLTFFQAVEKQLGLHLEGGQKHPMPVLVIDHVEPLGPDN